MFYLIQKSPNLTYPSSNVDFMFQPCTESLFLGLFHEFYSILSPLLLELIQQNHAPVDPFDLPAILSKDAVYNAVGLAAFDMYDEVSVSYQWFV